MLIVEDDFDISLENLTKFMVEAQSRFEQLKSLEKDHINIVIENMFVDEPEVAICLGSINESLELNEYIVKHVNSRGVVTRRKDRKTRERNAFQTTGLSKSKRRQIARRVVKTKRANPSIGKRAERKRKKALRRRKALGL